MVSVPNHAQPAPGLDHRPITRGQLLFLGLVNTPQIGPLLQKQRKSMGLTLGQLSYLSGVSRSMLSQIERGQANPSLGVTWSLTRALKIDISDLLAGATAMDEEPGIELVSAALTPEIRSPDGLCRLRILSAPHFAGSTEWYEAEIEPSGVLDSEPHPRGAVEHFTAFTSGFRVTSGNSTRALGVGENARYAADVRHRITNTSGKRARGIVVLLYR